MRLKEFQANWIEEIGLQMALQNRSNESPYLALD
jgi:hypothetical protein